MEPFLYLDSPEKARLFSLVLTARGIPHELKDNRESTNQGRYVLWVKEDLLDIAEKEIELFIKENIHYFQQISPGQPPKPFIYLKKSLLTLVFFACLMSITFRYEVRDYLLKNFSADTEKILNGEPWRCFTALFLHSDPAHFFSNMFMAAVFFSVLFEETGVLIGWITVLLSGAIGNYLNALTFQYDHVSIGLSTSIFAAIGAYCSIKIWRQRINGVREAFKVFLSGLALLGLLGTGEGNIDILAHFWGFISGLLSGLLFVLALSFQGRH